MNAMTEICLYCKHRNKDCEFGENIPDLILVGRFNHKTPIGKEKILFEFDNNKFSNDRKRYVDFDFVDKKEAKNMLKKMEGKII